MTLSLLNPKRNLSQSYKICNFLITLSRIFIVYVPDLLSIPQKLVFGFELLQINLVRLNWQ